MPDLSLISFTRTCQENINFKQRLGRRLQSLNIPISKPLLPLLCGKCRPESEGRVDGVGDCLPRSGGFGEWDESEDRAVHAVLFCYFVMMI